MSSLHGMTEMGPISETCFYNELKEMENSKIVILQSFIITYGKADLYWPQKTHKIYILLLCLADPSGHAV